MEKLILTRYSLLTMMIVGIRIAITKARILIDQRSLLGVTYKHL